jgi:S-adenosylmethionine hydrolase
MPDSIITLTTDFGEDSPYAAVMKGVILGLSPHARLMDLTHQIPPQDIRHAAYFLATALPYFPRETLHVIVVDPGVGSERALLYVEVMDQRLLVPDNGCWTELDRAGRSPPRVRRLTEDRYWRQPVSKTFHGRDILAPVAAHLSLGLDPALLGPSAEEWVRLDRPPVLTGRNSLTGHVVFIDHFGNLITNLRQESLGAAAGADMVVRVARESPRWVHTYADAGPGTLVALVSSSRTVEVAVVQGNAARLLGAGIGTPVRVEWID